MIALLQRVSRASVCVADEVVASIQRGILVFVGIEKSDGAQEGQRLAQRLLNYRVFSDAEGRMNLSVQDIGAGVLFVPQFTLAADTTRGLRPSFACAAAPEVARPLFDHVVSCARAAHPTVEAGRFGADMQVTLTNDGPVTFVINVVRSA